MLPEHSAQLWQAGAGFIPRNSPLSGLGATTTTPHLTAKLLGNHRDAHLPAAHLREISTCHPNSQLPTVCPVQMSHAARYTLSHPAPWSRRGPVKTDAGWGHVPRVTSVTRWPLRPLQAALLAQPVVSARGGGALKPPVATAVGWGFGKQWWHRDPV